MSCVMSPDMQQAYEKAQVINDKFTVNDFFSNCVLIEHEDGTRLFYTYALLMKEGHWWMVFTEHHGFHIYHDEDCKVKEFEQKWTKSENE